MKGRLFVLCSDALAITLHNRQLDIVPLVDYARARGITLIRGVERDIGGKHALLINFSPLAQSLRSFDDLAALKRAEPQGLVVAAHPFFPTGSCLGRLMDRHAELFDAVEFNAMYSRLVNFNAAAERWATAHDRPIVWNADVHRLEQLGSTYSLVESEPSPEAIWEAIRHGRVVVRSIPLPLTRAAWIFAKIVPAGIRGRLKRATAGSVS